jgi:hypothetical protein
MRGRRACRSRRIFSATNPVMAGSFAFSGGDLVISVYGNGDGSGPYTDNQASPITLREVTTAGNALGQLVLPQTQTTVNGATNYPISGEYGSSSEGTLELSNNGRYLTIAGYDVGAVAFNSNAQGFGRGTKTCITSGPSAVTCYPPAQTASVPNFPGSPGSGVTTAIVVLRVIALVGADGSVDTSTALTGVYNENNPRSAATSNGSSFYISGQGFDKNDTTTQGLFLATRGATTATPIDTSFDTRTVEIQNTPLPQLYLSADSTEGSGVHENISSYGSQGNLPTTTASATILTNLKSKLTVTSASQLNTLQQNIFTDNPAFVAGGNKIYISPENYFFANATTLYVADSGNPKGDNNGPGKAPQGLSDGGLQKWSFNGTQWVLEYTLSAGLLDFVPDTTPCGANQVNCGTTGLIGLAGKDVTIDGVPEAELFATNSTLGDLDQTYLYGIKDVLADMTLPTNEKFAVLDTAAPDTNIRGVAFAPVAEPGSLSLLAAGLLGLGIIGRRRRRVFPTIARVS